MTMNSDRNIEKEMENELELRKNQDQEWEPWGPLDWPDDYGDYEFYADRLKRQEKYGMLKTLSTARSALIEFKEKTGVIDEIDEIGTYEAERFVEWLSNQTGVKDSTVDTYIVPLASMAGFYSDAEYYPGNPFSHIEPQSDNGDRSSNLIGNSRVEVSIEELKEGINSFGIKNTNVVVLVFLAKTGVRASEACNLDDEDFNIDHPVWDSVQPRSEIRSKPDTVWVSANKKRDSFDDKSGSNKRKVSTPIPIDQELKQLLVWYATIRPKTVSKGNPFFRSNKQNTSRRFHSRQLGYLIEKWAEYNDLYAAGNGEMDNVTAHWFRAFFTTELRSNVSENEADPLSVRDFVKGLRGDVGPDVIDKYTQIYDDYREVVVENVPKFDINLV